MTMDPMVGSASVLLPEWGWAALVGLCAGSLMGVLARRLPAGQPVLLARSACDTCHTPLGARELVPLLSYVWQGGRCRHCDAPIGLFHPAMELAAAALALWAGSVFSGEILWASCLLGWFLLALGVCDWGSFRLPDALTLPLLLLGLSATAWLWPEALGDHALAAALGYLAFRGVALLYRRLRGRDGLGAGDAKLLAAAGAWVGLAELPSVVLIAALAGLVLALGLAIRKGALSGRMMLPFGPALALATWLVWLYG
jgi:leader peptidase (prepilin peptidase) / N-methyltransferase